MDRAGRSENWSANQPTALAELYVAEKAILEAKLSSRVTKDVKSAAWERVAQNLNKLVQNLSFT